MMKEIILREYQETDRMYLEDIIRETWNYDKFCSPIIAKKMAKLYLNSCLINQTFTKVALINHIPVGIIMGKDIQKHKYPIRLRIKWINSIISLCCLKEGRKVLKIFNGVEGIDRQLLSICGKKYKGELAFFVIDKKSRGKGIGRKLFQSAVDYMKSQNIFEFYLFTDTSCNYPFYEHLGLTKQCEIQQEINTNYNKETMTFFIYDYHC